MTEAPRPSIDIEALLASARDKNPRLICRVPAGSDDSVHQSIARGLGAFGFRSITSDGKEFPDHRLERFVSDYPCVAGIVVIKTSVKEPQNEQKSRDIDWKTFPRRTS